MSNARVACILLLAGSAVSTHTSAQQSRPPELPASQRLGARLVDFGHPARLPGQFLVRIKTAAELVSARSDPTAPVGEVLPKVVPMNEAAVRRLARALTSAHNGQLTGVFSPGEDGRWSFTVAAISDTDLLALATDPRLESITAVLPADVQRASSREHP